MTNLIEYEDSSDEVRAVYDDIRATRQTDYINNFWKALANHPPTLQKTWETLKEVMASPGEIDPRFARINLRVVMRKAPALSSGGYKRMSQIYLALKTVHLFLRYNRYMLNLTYIYRLKLTHQQSLTYEAWLETSRRVWNFALGERKDWYNSRSCRIDACSIKSEYIIRSDAPRPTFASQCKALTQARKTNPYLNAAHSQMLQQVLRRLEKAFIGVPKSQTKLASEVAVEKMGQAS